MRVPETIILSSGDIRECLYAQEVLGARDTMLLFAHHSATYGDYIEIAMDFDDEPLGGRWQLSKRHPSISIYTCQLVKEHTMLSVYPNMRSDLRTGVGEAIIEQIGKVKKHKPSSPKTYGQIYYLPMYGYDKEDQ